MRWEEETVWDATGDDGLARSLPLEATLADAGFVELGALGTALPGQGKLDGRTDRRPLFRSSDGAIVALAGPTRGGERLLLLTLLDDGTVVRTAWRKRWRRGRTAAATIAHHQARITGPAIPLDVRAAGAVYRRAQHLHLAPSEWAASSLAAYLAPLGAVALFALAQRATAPLPVDAHGALDVVAARRIVFPEAVRDLGLGVGAVIGTIAFLADAFTRVMLGLLLGLIGAMSFLGSDLRPRLVDAGVLGWLGVGLGATAAWALVVAPRLGARWAAPVPALDAATVLRRYALAFDPLRQEATHDPTVAPATQAALRDAGFVPLGPRLGVGEGKQGKAPAPVARSELLVSADGTCVAEVRTLADDTPSVALTSIVGFDTVIETRTLPDPGPLSDRTDPKLIQWGYDGTVTGASIRRGLAWPTLATSSVADRPRVGLRVALVDSLDEALRHHRARVAEAGGQPAWIETPRAAVDLLEVADRRRVPRRTNGDRLALVASALLVPAMFAVLFGETVGLDGLRFFASAWIPMVVIAGFGQPTRDPRTRLTMPLYWAAFLVGQGGRTALAPSGLAVSAALLALTVLLTWAWLQWLPHSRATAAGRRR